jgi:hypothetical protein
MHCKSRLLDHLVGAGGERWRHVEAERLGGDETGRAHSLEQGEELEQARERLDPIIIGRSGFIAMAWVRACRCI